jgi:small subunit ribosomal protein S1
VDVKILRVDTDERKIGLSLKRAQFGDTEAGAERAADGPPPPSKGGMDEHGALGTDKIQL